MQNTSALAAVVPAAGVGRRMQLTTPKQYLTIAGQTLLQHSVAALAQDARVELIIIAHAADDNVAKQLAFTTRVPILWVEGGATRAASVAAGVRAAQQRGYQYVAVHDAARPCLQADELADVINAGMTHKDGALLAIPVADTLKRAQGAYVAETLAREQLWRAQTPQVFPTELLAQALQRAGVDNPLITDEASAVELMGGNPQLVQGRATNIKVTQPGDDDLAALFLAKFASQASTHQSTSRKN